MKGSADPMNNLLKLEYRKLKKQKSFYICGGIMLTLLVLSALVTRLLLGFAASLSEDLSALAITGADFLLDTLNSCSFVLIISIFTALTVCGDFEQQTIKNIYAKGYSREQVYLAKLTAVWGSSSVLFLATEAVSLVLGILFFGTQGLGDLKLPGLIAAQYAAVMAETALFFAVSAILRRTGAAIAVVVIGPMLIDTGFAVMDVLLETDFAVGDIWISSFLSDLSDLTVSPGRIAACLACSAFYMAAFLLIGFLFQRKTEL